MFLKNILTVFLISLSFCCIAQSKYDPLYVVNGHPQLKNPFDSIKPTEIKSIKILSIADGTAIYGTIGMNGVVLITTKEETPKITMKPYISIGTSIGQGTLTYAIESGFYNHSWWVGGVAELSKISLSQQWQVYIGPKIYKSVADISYNSQLFIYGAMKMNTNHERDLVFEPGIAYVFFNGEKFALQISMSTPINEGQQIGKPINLSTGLSLNYWIR